MSTGGKITLLLISYLVASGRARSVADSTLHQVTLQLKAIDGLLAEVGKEGHQMPERIAHLANRQTKFRWIDSVYRRSARLLGAMAISQVRGQISDLNFAFQKMNELDKLVQTIQYFGTDFLGYRKEYFHWLVFHAATDILMNLAGVQVKLISQRNGPQGAQIDSTLTKIEEKSYQLKTMLIQLKQDKTVPVSYFPTELKELNYNTQIKADSLQQGITSIVAEQNPNIV